MLSLTRAWFSSQILPGVKVIIAHTETKGPLGDSHLGEVRLGSCVLEPHAARELLLSLFPSAPDLWVLSPLGSHMLLGICQAFCPSPLPQARLCSCTQCPGRISGSLGMSPRSRPPTNRETLSFVGTERLQEPQRHHQHGESRGPLKHGSCTEPGASALRDWLAQRRHRGWRQGPLLLRTCPLARSGCAGIIVLIRLVRARASRVIWDKWDFLPGGRLAGRAQTSAQVSRLDL